ncbi:MAG: peptidylprolyl isomerase [Bdellovibrionota bacterium]|jgi:cyclophilin family peptidyl-prolyl cis-trans isomerase|nr:peptidylprolyl isomerase [Bdellovibrionota bacterium]
MKMLLLALFFTFSLQAQVVVMETSMGTVEITLNKKKAPKTVENFLEYVKSGFYNGTIFHRVMDNFMIQGGGYTTDLKKKETRSPIKNEANNGLANSVGTIAMARTGDPHSATAQFFINVNDNTFLNHTSQTPRGWGYAVFGKVTKGMTVINRIKKVTTAPNGPHQNLPTENVIIKKMSLKK